MILYTPQNGWYLSSNYYYYDHLLFIIYLIMMDMGGTSYEVVYYTIAPPSPTKHLVA
jgi:hypothetical protein